MIDMTPGVTDFPHIRSAAAIQSNNGSCMFIPREDDKMRLYVQLDPKDYQRRHRYSRMGEHVFVENCN